MDFTLYYDGILTSNAKAAYKQRIREQFHEQLKELWDQEPLANLEPELYPRKDFSFAPLVHSQMRLIAEIDIVMLLPGSPGQIIRRGGDIDNRLKTLLDALTMPDPNQTPDGSPNLDQTPFFCLLEDDKLITGLSVKTDRLLKTGAESDEVKLLINVKTRAVVGTWGNLSLGT